MRTALATALGIVLIILCFWAVPVLLAGMVVKVLVGLFGWATLTYWQAVGVALLLRVLAVLVKGG